MVRAGELDDGSWQSSSLMQLFCKDQYFFISAKSQELSATYHKNCKVRKMIAATSDNSIFTDICSTTFSGPVLKSKAPGDTHCL